MKKILCLIALIAVGFSSAVEVPDNVLDAIATVESRNDDDAVGDNGAAVGRYQLHKVYVDEVNRICRIKRLGKVFTYEDRRDGAKSREMTRIYLSYWGDRYEANTARTATATELAKLHNGGAFYNRKATAKNATYFRNIANYANKVNSELGGEK